MAEASITSAARWLVSPIIKIMVDKAHSYISSQYNWQSDMEGDLKRLEITLLQILMVVSKAEKRPTLDGSQITLLQHIKDAVYDAEDVLDEFEYLLLRSKSERKSSVSCIGFSSPSIRKRLHDKFRLKLTNMLNILDRINTSAEMFLQMMVAESCNVIEQPELVQLRVTSSFLHEDIYFGRDKVREELINKLLSREDEPESSNEYTVLSIFGTGGIGKTTLAQHIYNDRSLADHFDRRIWVCVSNKFDKMRLTKEILISVTKDENIDLTNFTFNMLQEELQEKVALKKFLLVLDDVWYDENVGEPLNKEAWMELFAPLKTGEKGSKILVTTRMELAAKMLDAPRNFFLELKGLEINDSWLLFRQYAFGGKNSDSYPELQIIGRQIIQRLGGSPYAIKVVGRQLNGNFNVEEWQRVVQNYVSSDIMKILRLSYERLPEHLQRCFAYCSLFPKGCVLERDRLVDMWIAQGFVQPQNSNKCLSMQDIGRGYFEDLLSRSFFQTLVHNYQKYYAMHDLMSDLALNVSEGECFRLECDNSLVRNIPRSVRHLYVSVDNVDQLKNVCELKKLRSLIFQKKSWVCSNIFLQDDVFNELDSVRVLDLGGCCLKRLPDAIVHSIHLRYLAIQRPYHPLSDSLCSLHHLQTLSVHHHSCFIVGRQDLSMTNPISMV